MYIAIKLYIAVKDLITISMPEYMSYHRNEGEEFMVEERERSLLREMLRNI